MSEAKYILDVKIIRHNSKKLLGLCQEAYIKKIFEHFTINYSKPTNSLVKMALTLILSQCPEADKEKETISNVFYVNVVGSLTYSMLVDGQTFSLRLVG